MYTFETSSHPPKRKLGTNDDREHFYSFDIEHDQSTKSFCCRSPPSNNNLNKNNYTNSLSNYQQTTKIIQEFNIQQSTTSDITVSSTINIKSTPKPQLKLSNNDLLSEADFQRVVQDITPADRDLFDEFLNGIKQKTDDYLFLSTFDDLPSSSSTSSSQEHDSISKRHSSLSLPSQTSSTLASDRRRNSMPRGSSTIHYSPHSMPISNRPPASAAAQTLKQMAVQHQQRIMYNQQQTTTATSASSSYSNFPYNTNNSTRQYYQQSQISSECETSADPNSYYQPMCYPSTHPATVSGYNHHHSQQRSNIYGIQNYSYQTSSSSSFYQQQQQQQQQQQSALAPPAQISTSSHPITNYSPSNGLPTATSTLPFYSPDDNLPILDL